MDASYAYDWPVLPGTEPRPITLVQWPSPPRVQLHSTTQLTAQLTAQLPTLLPDQVSSQVPAQLPDQVSDQVPDQVPNQVSDQVLDQLPDQVSNQVSDQVPNQLPDQVLNQVPDQAPTGRPTMPLPPQAQYESYDALYHAAQLFAKNHGYAFTNRRSKKINSQGRIKKYLDCDRHNYGDCKARQHRQRRTNTRANGCQFGVVAVESSDRKSWELRHWPGSQSSIHNHSPSLHPSAHAIHRKLDWKDQIVAQNLAQAGN